MSDSESSGSFTKKRKVISESHETFKKFNEDALKGYSPAPFELLTEFLFNIMKKDYKKALYYCSKILMYEPDNWIVKKFYPLIIKKLELDYNEVSSSELSDSSTTSTTSSKSSVNKSLRETSSDDDSSPEDKNDGNGCVSIGPSSSKERKFSTPQKRKQKRSVSKQKRDPSLCNLQKTKIKLKLKCKYPVANTKDVKKTKRKLIC